MHKALVEEHIESQARNGYIRDVGNHIRNDYNRNVRSYTRSVCFGNYVEFDIVEVAQRCGIPIIKPVGNKELGARCPFCGDSENPTHCHLYLEPRRGLYYCHKCGEGGNTLKLYAAMRGITTKEAYKELLKACYYIPTLRSVRKTEVRINIEEEVIAPLERRDKVYRALLEMLPLLSRHRADLLRRGLPADVIERNMYRSLPCKKENRERIAGTLAEKYSLIGIPGFYQEEDGKWTMVPVKGYAIPVRDPKGRIQGLQCRLDDPTSGAKYIWFSSRGRKNGTGARTWIHVTEPVGQSPKERVWITEGPLKADIAAHYLGVRFLGVPGVTSWKRVMTVVEEMGVKEVVLAYDMDQLQNPAVEKAAGNLKAELEKNSVAVITAKWPPETGKGIDDACVTLTRERKVVTEETFIEGELRVTKTKTVTVTETVKVEGREGLFTRLFRFITGR